MKKNLFINSDPSKAYEAPSVTVFTVRPEGVLCFSGEPNTKLPDAEEDDWGDL